MLEPLTINLILQGAVIVLKIVQGLMEEDGPTEEEKREIAVKEVMAARPGWGENETRLKIEAAVTKLKQEG